MVKSAWAKLWGWLSDIDTVLSWLGRIVLGKVVLGTLGGLGGGLVSALSTIGPTGIFFSVLGGLVLGMLLSELIRAKRIRKMLSVSLMDKKASGNKATAEIPDSMRDVVSWMQGISAGDAGDLAARVVAWAKKPELYLNQDPPFIDFPFDVVNTTVFLVELGKEIKGHIRAAGRVLIQPRELAPRSGNTGEFMHAQRHDLVIRQYLSPDDINFCLFYKEPQNDNAPVPFDFFVLDVSITTHEAPGFKSLKAVRIHLSTPIYVPIGDLVRSQDGVGNVGADQQAKERIPE